MVMVMVMVILILHSPFSCCHSHVRHVGHVGHGQLVMVVRRRRRTLPLLAAGHRLNWAAPSGHQPTNPARAASKVLLGVLVGW